MKEKGNFFLGGCEWTAMPLSKIVSRTDVLSPTHKQVQKQFLKSEFGHVIYFKAQFEQDAGKIDCSVCVCVHVDVY